MYTQNRFKMESLQQAKEELERCLWEREMAEKLYVEKLSAFNAIEAQIHNDTTAI